MSRSGHVLCVAVALCAWLAGCEDTEGEDAAVDASAPDAEIDARIDEPPPRDAGTLPDAAPAEDGGQPIPDAGPVDGSPCGEASCAKADLVVELPTEDLALSFRTVEITEDDCELFEGCVGGTGTRSLVELSFTLRNAGDAALELGRPFENPLYYPSFCQDSYVIDGFFAAEIRAADGDLVASGRMSTSCIADAEGGYTCRAQGLSPDGASAQPIGRCDFLDITGLAEGDYTLSVTANADHAVPESDFDNNTSHLSFHYVPCDGTVCGGACCPAGVQCYQDTCMLPDLRINEDSAAGSMWITHQTFGEDSCELEEMCVNGEGRRRLLQFEGRIENWGPGDLNPGPEHDNPLYEYSECHDHYHFLDFTDYRLLNQDGTVAAFGHKQSFCLVDMVQVEGATVVAPHGTRPPPGETGCSYLTAGWADIYGVGTPCQWVDITDVPPGDYVLQLTVNPETSVREADLDNNVVQIPVTITEDVPCVPQPEICGDTVDQDCDDQPDVWDPDCSSCSPFDPFCEDVEEVSGNGSCETAYAITESATYQAWIDQDDAGEIAPSCGGQGGDVFFTFTLDSEQAVYLGTMGSSVDTVLAVYAADCDGTELRCEDDACNTAASQFVAVLPAGDYLVAIKARDAGEVGRVRLKYQHADANGAIVLDSPGVYAGDTSASDDTVQACAYEPPPYPGNDGGVGFDGGAPSEEACVHTAEAAAGSLASHECLHCACGIDAAAIAGCGEMCWQLLDCVTEECGGDGSAIMCIVDACSDFLGGVSQAQAAQSALQSCDDTCEVGVGGGPSDGGVGEPGLSPAPDDVYVLASCQQGITISTCGSSMFDSVIEVRAGSLDSNGAQECSESYDMCQADGLGAAINSYVSPGLTFVVIDGTSDSERGEYQMSVIY